MLNFCHPLIWILVDQSTSINEKNNAFDDCTLFLKTDVTSFAMFSVELAVTGVSKKKKVAFCCCTKNNCRDLKSNSSNGNVCGIFVKKPCIALKNASTDERQ